ncbi:hypothetical protein ACWCPF_38095 [Streptomyces sp. NPDC001858]
MAPDSPMRRLGTLLPRLSPAHPLLPQLLHAANAQPDNPELSALRESVTSEPGRSAVLLRRLFYLWLDLPEPTQPAATRAIPVPSPEPSTRQVPHLPATLVTAATTAEGVCAEDAAVWLRRFPAALQRTQDRHLVSAHLAADPDDPDPRWPRSADVLLLPLERGLSPAEVKWSDFTHRFPGCRMVAVEEADRSCTAVLDDGTRLRCSWAVAPAWASFAVAASVAHIWAQSTAEPIHPGARGRISVRAGSLLDQGLIELTVL